MIYWMLPLIGIAMGILFPSSLRLVLGLISGVTCIISIPIAWLKVINWKLTVGMGEFFLSLLVGAFIASLL